MSLAQAPTEITYIEQDIIHMLEKFDRVPGESHQHKLVYRFLDAGHIDSLSIINFITDIEDKYGINLSPDDTQSDEFRFVGGLARIVHSKVKLKT